MELINALRTKLSSWIHPSTAIVLAPKQSAGRWVQVRDEGTNVLLGYEHTCVCSAGMQKYKPNQALVQNHCRTCLREVNLQQALSIGAVHTELVNLKPAPQRTTAWTGNDPVEVVWSGGNVAGRAAAYDRGDPGLMGPGFGGRG